MILPALRAAAVCSAASLIFTLPCGCRLCRALPGLTSLTLSHSKLSKSGLVGLTDLSALQYLGIQTDALPFSVIRDACLATPATRVRLGYSPWCPRVVVHCVVSRLHPAPYPPQDAVHPVTGGLGAAWENHGRVVVDGRRH